MKKLLIIGVFALSSMLLAYCSALPAQVIVGEYSVGEKFAEVNIQGYTSSLIWGGKISQNSASLFILSPPENIMVPTGYRWLFKDDSAITFIFTLGGTIFELKPKANNRVKVWVK